MHCAFRGEQMKGCEFQVAYRIHRPAIAPIRRDVIAHHLLPRGRVRQQIVYLKTALGSLSERGDLVGKRRSGGRADSGVLLLQQLLRLGRPGHQFAIETKPVRSELIPKPSARGGDAHAFEKRPFKIRVVKKSSSGACVTNTDAFAGHSEGFSSGVLITANDDHGARTHVLFLAHNARNSGMSKVSERFRGMLQQPRRFARLARRHRGR